MFSNLAQLQKVELSLQVSDYDRHRGELTALPHKNSHEAGEGSAASALNPLLQSVNLTVTPSNDGGRQTSAAVACQTTRQLRLANRERYAEAECRRFGTKVADYIPTAMLLF